MHQAFHLFIRALRVSEAAPEDYANMAVACLMICIKCHEIDYNLPALEEVVIIFTTSKIVASLDPENLLADEPDLIKTEERIVNQLQWDFNPTLAFDYLETYMSLGVCNLGDRFTQNLSSQSADTAEASEKRQDKCLKNLNKLNRVLVRVNLLVL